jgi:hypothetical protein
MKLLTPYSERFKHSFYTAYIYYINKPRLLLLLVVSFSIMLFLLLFFNQLRTNLYDTWVNNFLGGGSLVAENNTTYDYFSPLKADSIIDVSGIYAKHPFLQSISSPRIKVNALFQHEEREVGAVVYGVDFTKEMALNNHITVLSGGTVCQSNQKEIIMTEQLAKNLDIDLGDRVIIAVTTVDGYPNYELLTLTGYFDTGNVALFYSNSVAYIPISVIRDVMLADQDAAHEILVGDAHYNQNIPGLKYYPAINKLALPKMANNVILILETVLVFFFIIFMLQIILSQSLDSIEQRKNEFSVSLSFGSSVFEIMIQNIIELFIYFLFLMVFGLLVCLLLISIFNNLHFYSFSLPIEFIFSAIDFQIRVDFLLVSIVSLLFFSLFAIVFLALLYKNIEKNNLQYIYTYMR